jgi:transposase
MARQDLEQQIQALIEENKRLHHRIADLERELAKSRKTSKTSSKPPSSDLVKPPTSPKKLTVFGKRTAGGQPGHPKYERDKFPPEQLTRTQEYALTTCPACGTALEAADRAPKVIQQVEIVERPVQIEEHRGLAFWCPQCRTIHYAPLPCVVTEGGLFGPRLTALWPI